MFLSEETQPDYRPIDVRKKEAPKKPCPRIDHRPLGADSYSKVSKNLLKLGQVSLGQSKNAIVASDKNNDRKFMFLSEKTQPDYRPIDVRKKEKPCLRIDH